MAEFNPNCGKCGMLNSRGFCSLTACRYPANVIVSEPKVIRGMMVNPQIEKPMSNGKSICDNCEKYPCTDDETKLMLRCPAFSPKPKPMTHFDEIKAMSVEELAKHICCPYDQCIDLDRPCSDCVVSWLKAPVEEET